jgi:HSP20 family protein
MSLARLFPEFKIMKHELYDPFEAISRESVPRMDVIETKDGYAIKADVPGFTKDQIDIDIQGGTLSIKGKYEKVQEQDDEHYHAQERYQSSFSRSLTLPFHVDPEKVNANLKDGVLEVLIPKDPIKGSKVAITA